MPAWIKQLLLLPGLLKTAVSITLSSSLIETTIAHTTDGSKLTDQTYPKHIIIILPTAFTV